MRSKNRPFERGGDDEKRRSRHGDVRNRYHRHHVGKPVQIFKKLWFDSQN